jgi:hypothetical protein
VIPVRRDRCNHLVLVAMTFSITVRLRVPIDSTARNKLLGSNYDLDIQHHPDRWFQDKEKKRGKVPSKLPAFLAAL